MIRERLTADTVAEDVLWWRSCKRDDRDGSWQVRPSPVQSFGPRDVTDAYRLARTPRSQKSRDFDAGLLDAASVVDMTWEGWSF